MKIIGALLVYLFHGLNISTGILIICATSNYDINRPTMERCRNNFGEVKDLSLRHLELNQVYYMRYEQGKTIWSNPS